MDKQAQEKSLTLNEYQVKALSTAIFPRDREIPYLALALCGEAGEVADKVKKVIRDKAENFSDQETRIEIAMEAGDCLWYLANLANSLGFTLYEIALMNLDKINRRKQNGTLQGSGDNR